MVKRNPSRSQARTREREKAVSFPESTPQMTRWCALLIAIVSSFATAQFVVTAVQVERTGAALYSPHILFYPLLETERVTRATAPEKFQQALTFSWFRVFLFGAIALLSFFFYRRLSD